MSSPVRLADAVRQLVAGLDRSQWLSPGELLAEQHRLLAIVAAHHATESPSFAARLDAAGLVADDLGSPDGLAALPPLSRRALQAAGPDLYAAHVPRTVGSVHETRTSGSTGEPVVVRRTKLDGLLWSALALRDFEWRDLDYATRFSAIRASVTTYVEQPGWGRPAGLLHRTGPSQAIPITMPIEEIVAALDRFRPNIVLVYPSVLVGLLEHWRRRGSALRDVAAVHTIGETLDPTVRAETIAELGCFVWDVYSSQELGAIAADCPSPSGLLHVMAESVLVELLDDDGRPCPEGVAGRLVITDLHNHATPLIRYDIGDLGMAGPPCGCERGLPTLARVLGRERNLVVHPDGRRHWPLVGFHRFAEVAPIVQYQLVQHAMDDIEVRLVVDRPATPAEEAALRDVIQGALGHPFPLRFTYVADALPRGPGGKIEEFVSLVI